MRDYGKVSPKFWMGATGKQLRKKGVEAQLVALYLMTSPHANMLGLYYLPTMFIAHETGLGMEGASMGLARCCEAGFCHYDEDSEMVWVPEMAQYQIAESLKEKDLRVKGVQNEYDALPGNPYLKPFFEKYGRPFLMERGRDFDSAAQAPLKPLVSQEQEQEQEQEQNQDTSGSAPSAAAPPDLDLGPSDERPAKPRPVDVVFDHWQSVMGSPRSKLDAKREKVIKGALKAGYSSDDLCKAIDGCALSPFHMGLNDQRTKYNGIDLILRNADQIDKFVALADAPPPASPAPGGGGKMPGAADWAESTESVMAMAKRHGLEQHNDEHYIWFRLRVIKAHGDEALMERELSSASRRNEGEYERVFKLFFGVAPKMLPNGGYEKRPQRASF